MRYLNGDLAAWVENGGTLETKFNQPRPVSDFGVPVPAHPEYLATTKQVECMCADKNAVIADDRSWTEFSARDKKGCYYEFFCTPGHVPNAVWVHDMYWYLMISLAAKARILQARHPQELHLDKKGMGKAGPYAG